MTDDEASEAEASEAESESARGGGRPQQLRAKRRRSGSLSMVSQFMDVEAGCDDDNESNAYSASDHEHERESDQDFVVSHSGGEDDNENDGPSLAAGGADDAMAEVDVVLSQVEAIEDVRDDDHAAGSGGAGGGGDNGGPDDDDMQSVDALLADLEFDHADELYTLCGVDAFVQMPYNEWRSRVHKLDNRETRVLIHRFYDFTGGGDNTSNGMERMFPADKCTDEQSIVFYRECYLLRYLYVCVRVDFLKADKGPSCDDGLIPEHSATALVLTEQDLGKLAGIYTRIREFAQIRISVARITASRNPTFHPLYAFHDTHFVVSRDDFVTYPPIKQALLWVMHKAQEQEAVLLVDPCEKERTVCWPRVYRGRNTHTYVPFCALKPLTTTHERDTIIQSTVTKYLHDLAEDPLRDPRSNDILISKGPGLIPQLATILNSGRNACLPVLVPDRHVMSFTNGLWSIKNQTFYDYDSIGSNRRLVAVKFFEQEFEPLPEKRGFFYPSPDGSRLESDSDFPPRDILERHWSTIRTPLDQIFDDQITDNPNASYRTDNPKLVMLFAWAFIGRLLYNVGERDNHQRTLVILGGSECGKSVIGDVISAFYPAQDVRVTGDQHEDMFGIGALYGGLVWMIKDGGKNSKFTLADFLSMTTGEALSIRIKHQTAFSDVFTSPGLILGNAFFSKWTEEPERYGAVLRRLALFRFRNPVANYDPKLKQKCFDSIGRIILKATLAYNSFADYSNEHPASIATWWPDYFNDCLGGLMSNVNSLQAFVQAKYTSLPPKTEHYIRSAFVVPLDAFQAQYKVFCAETGMKEIRLDLAQLPDVLRDRDVFLGYVKKLADVYPQPLDSMNVVVDRLRADAKAVKKAELANKSKEGTGIAVLKGLVEIRRGTHNGPTDYQEYSISSSSGGGGSGGGGAAAPGFVNDNSRMPVRAALPVAPSPSLVGSEEPDEPPIPLPLTAPPPSSSTPTTTTTTSTQSEFRQFNVSKLMEKLDSIYTDDRVSGNKIIPKSVEERVLQDLKATIDYALGNVRSLNVEQQAVLQQHRLTIITALKTPAPKASSAKESKSNQSNHQSKRTV